MRKNREEQQDGDEIPNAIILPNLFFMKSFSIAVIPGDGVGKEVTPAAQDVLTVAGRKFDAQFEFEEFAWGADYYFKNGRMMPENALDLLKPKDAILLGAVGDPRIADNVTLNGLLLPIRRGFDQFANVRPAILYKGVEGPLAKKVDIDMVVVRENTEGEYAQVGGFLYQGHPDEVAIQTGVFTRRGIDRVVRFAFELARKRNKKRRVCSITKSNAQGYAMVLWDRVFDRVAGEYPDISTESLLVDVAAMNFIRLAGKLRRCSGIESVWRYSERCFGDHCGEYRTRAQRQPRSDAEVSFDVRTGTWFGAGYCRARCSESHGGDSIGRNAARSCGFGSGGPGCRTRGRGGVGGRKIQDCGPGRIGFDAPGYRRDYRENLSAASLQADATRS